MSESNTWQPEINVAQDQAVKQNWANLFALLSQSQDRKTNSKALIDQLILELTYNWLEENDQCGVYQDLLDVGLNSLVGGPLQQIAGEDLSGYLPPDLDVEGILPEGSQALSASTPARSTTAAPGNSTEDSGGGRQLQFFTQNTCSSFESTVFLGSMLKFSNCANLDIGKFFGSVEENMVNAGLTCLNTFLQPFQMTNTCASRNFQNYVMDECVKGVLYDDVLGHLFQLFLVSPKQTCGCMASLTTVPTCRVNVTKQVSLDGMLTSKMACLLESQVCNKLEDECDGRLNVLNTCLPPLEEVNLGNFDCEEVLCNCERNDRGLMNYAGKAMELPMSDMCTDQAAMNYPDEFVAERYAIFQEKCGAEYINEAEPPSVAPSAAPSMSPTTGPGGNLNSLIRGQQSSSQVNSVMSGILLALAITGVASIFLVFVLVLWRRRFRSKGRQVRTIDEMKHQAQEQIRKLQDDIRRMEAQQQQLSDESDSGEADSANPHVGDF